MKILHKHRQNVIVLFGAADLYSSMTAEVKVKFIGMSDVRINSSTSRNVSTASNLTIKVNVSYLDKDRMLLTQLDYPDNYFHTQFTFFCKLPFSSRLDHSYICPDQLQGVGAGY